MATSHQHCAFLLLLDCATFTFAYFSIVLFLEVFSSLFWLQTQVRLFRETELSNLHGSEFFCCCIQSNLDYPDYSFIQTFFSGPIFSWILISCYLENSKYQLNCFKRLSKQWIIFVWKCDKKFLKQTNMLEHFRTLWLSEQKVNICKYIKTVNFMIKMFLCCSHVYISFIYINFVSH